MTRKKRSWTRDLLRRNRNQYSQANRRHRRVMLAESLERRQMLAADLAGDDFLSAQVVSLPPDTLVEIDATIGDGLHIDADVDLYELDLVAGQTVTVDIDAYTDDVGNQISSLDSYLRVFDDAGNEIAYEHYRSGYEQSPNDYGYSYYDDYLSFTAATSGSFFIGVSANSNTNYDPASGGSGHGYGYSDEIGNYRVQFLSEAPPAPRLGVADTVVNEADGTATFDLTLSSAADSTITVDYATADLSASASEDYTATSGTLSFLPGETTASISVPIIDDGLLEPTQSFELRLTNPVGADISDDTGVGTIHDDDPDLAGDDLTIAQILTPTPGAITEIDANIGDGLFSNADVDLYRVDLGAGQTIDIDVDAEQDDAGNQLSSLDSYIRIFDQAGQEVSYDSGYRSGYGSSPNDYNSYGYYDDFLAFVAPQSGVYYIGISAEGNSSYDPLVGGSGYGSSYYDRVGDYRLQVQTDNPPVASLSIADAPVGESDGVATFDVTLSMVSDQVVTVDYSAADATAFAPDDYASVSGTLTFQPGETSQSITVSIIDDDEMESDETFALQLANAQGAPISVDLAIGTINDDDPDIAGDDLAGAQSIALTPNAILEVDGEIGDGLYGNADVDLYQIDLLDGQTLSIDVDAYRDDDGVVISLLDSYIRVFDDVGQEVVYVIGYRDGYATSPNDFGYDNYYDDYLSFTAPAAGTYYIGVAAESNNTYDPVVANSGYEGYYSSDLGEYRLQLMTDAPAVPTLSITNVSVDESAETATFTVTLDIASDETVTVDFATADGDATSGADYTSVSGSLLFAIGDLTRTIDVPISADSAYELDETFNVVISNAAGAIIGTAVGIGTITNDDLAPHDPAGDDISNAQVVTLLPNVSTELDAVIGDGRYPAADVDLYRVDLIAGQTISVDVDAKHDDSGSQISSLDSYLRFFDAAGQELGADPSHYGYASSNNDFGANTYDDYRVFTAVETGVYFIGVSAIGNNGYDPTIAGTGLATGVSTDAGAYRLQLLAEQPPVPTLSVNDATISESDSTFNLAVTLSMASSDTITVNYATLNGDASAPQDYAETSGSLTFLPGETSHSVSISIVDDSHFETAETFQFQLSNASGAPIFGDTANIVISSDDHDAPGDQLEHALTVSLIPHVPTEYQQAIGDGLYGSQDVDLYRLDLISNQTVNVNINAPAYLRVFDSAGTEIASHDFETGDQSDWSLTANADGTYYFGISDRGNTTYDPSTPTSTSDLPADQWQDYRLQFSTDDSAIDPSRRFYSVHHSQTLLVDVARGVLGENSAGYTASVVDNVTAGTLALQADGSFTYEPTSVGTFSFTFSWTDGTTTSNPIMVQIEVWNLVPLGNPDYYRVEAGNTLIVGDGRADRLGVLANDWDNDSDPLTVELVTDVTDGILLLNEDGTFTYTPAAGFEGTDSFTYEIFDPAESGNIVEVTIETWNGDMVAENDYYSTFHDEVLSVSAAGILANDWGGGGAALTIIPLSEPLHGTVSITHDGAFTYEPDPGYVGTDSFWYKFSDGNFESNAATVSIDVWNHIPEAYDNYYTTHAGVPVNVADYFSDDFEWDSDTITAEIVSQPSHGTLGTNSDGQLEYTPVLEPDDEGKLKYHVGLDSFTYKLSDGAEESEIATVSILARNFKPHKPDDLYLVHWGNSVTIDLLKNTSDLDGDELTFVITNGPTNGSFALKPPPTTGSNDDSAGDSEPEEPAEPKLEYVYTPDADFQGIETITVSVEDGRDGGFVEAQITIHVTNEQPWTLDDHYKMVQGNTITKEAGQGVLVNDLDYDDRNPLNADNPADEPADTEIMMGTLTATLVTPPSFHVGEFTLGEDGSFTYTPNPDFIGTDQFVYKANDGIEESVAGIVYIDVRGDEPVAIGDIYEIPEKTELITSVAGGVKSNDIMTLGVIDDSASGTPDENPDEAAANAAPADGIRAVLVTDVENGTLTLHENGAFSYTPFDTFVGHDEFTYRLIKPNGIAGHPAKVTIVVYEEDFPLHDDEYVAQTGRTLTVSQGDGVLTNDETESDSATVIVINDVDHGDLTLAPNGSFIYTPDADFDAGRVSQDSFTYKVDNDDPDSETATVVIRRLDIVGFDQTFTVLHDTPVTDQVQIGHESEPPQVGHIFVQGVDSLDNRVIIDVVDDVDHGILNYLNDGTFDYRPNPGYVGTDSFSYKVTNGLEFEELYDISFVMTNVAPDGEDDSYGYINDSTDIVVKAPGVLGNDTDVDGDTLKATLVSNVPTNAGTVTMSDDGSFVYSPTPGYEGEISFTYTITDGTLADGVLAQVGPLTATINVQMAELIANDWQFFVPHQESLSIPAVKGLLRTVNPDFYDFEFGDPDVTAHLVTPPLHASSFNLTEGGGFSYDPDNSFVGTDQFVYEAHHTDGRVSEPATVTINVTNEFIYLDYDIYFPDLDHGFSGDITPHAEDTDGDDLEVHKLTEPANGVVIVDVNGMIDYTPNDPSIFTYDQFDVSISDVFGMGSTYTVYIGGGGVGGSNCNVYTPTPLPGNQTWRDCSGLTVRNDSGGALNVTVGAGGLALSPAEGTSIIATVNGGSVSSAIAGGTINLAVLGGTLDSANAGGYMSVSADGGIGDLVGGDSVFANSGVDIGTINASKSIYAVAVGAIGTLDATLDAHANATNIGNITAGRDASAVGQVEILADGDYPETVYGAGSVGNVTAGRQVIIYAMTAGEVDAGGSVTMWVENISNNVTAGGSISEVYAVSIDATLDATGNIGSEYGTGIYALGNIGGTINADGSIFDVRSRGSVTATLWAAEDIYRVTAFRNVSGSITSENLVLVKAGGNVSANILTGELNEILAESISGATISAERIVSIWSNTAIAGSDIDATEDDDTYFWSIDDIAARDITGTTIDAVGTISSVVGSKSVDATIKANRSIFEIIAGELAGSIDATNDIESIIVTTGHSVANITAGGDLSELTIRHGSTSGNINITGAIDGVGIDAAGDVNGNITALSINEIEAGGGVGATINGGNDIGFITAGGSVGGSITAGGSVAHIKAGGGVGATLVVGNDLGYMFNNAFAGGITADGGVTGQIDVDDNIANIIAGDKITATITALGFVERIESGYFISSEITATEHIGSVTADAYITGFVKSISAHIGHVSSTWDYVGTTITAQTYVGEVRAFSHIKNSITATSGHVELVHAKYYHIMSPTISAGGYIGTVRSGRNIEGTEFTAQTWIGTIESGEQMGATITSNGYINEVHAGAQVLGGFVGNVTASSYINDFIVEDFGQVGIVPRGQIRPKPRRIDREFGNFEGKVDAGGQIGLLKVFGNLSGPAASTSGDDVSGSDGETSTETQYAIDAADLRFVFVGDALIGSLQSGAVVSANVWRNSTGDIHSASDTQLAVRDAITGNITAGGNVVAGSWANVSSEIQSGESTQLFALGTIEGKIDSGAHGVVTSYEGDLEADIDTMLNAILYGINVDTEKVHARGVLTVMADRDITSPFMRGEQGIVGVARTGSLNVVDWSAPLGAMQFWARQNFSGAAIARDDVDFVSFGSAFVGLIESSAGAVTYEGGEIDGDEIKSPRDVDINSLGGIKVGTISGGSGSVSKARLTALGDITSKVVRSDYTRLVTTDAITGETKDGNLGIFASAGTYINTELHASGGSVVAIAQEGVAGKIFGDEGIAVQSMGDISAVLDSPSGTIAAFAAKGLTSSAIVTGKNVVIDSWENVASSSITATDGHVIINSSGHVIAPTIAAPAGSIVILSHQSVTSTIDARDVVDLTVVGELTSDSVKAGQAVAISVWGDLTSPQIKAGTGAIIRVHGNADADVETVDDMLIDVSGTLTGQYKSTGGGDINVSVLGGVTAANINTSGNVDLLSAGAASELNIGSSGDSGSGDEPNFADVTVVGTVSGEVIAVGGALVETYGGGAITGNYRVRQGGLIVSAAGYTDGQFNGNQGLAVSTLGSAYGSYHSSHGDVSLSALSTFDATVDASGAIDLFTGDTAKGTLDAGGSVLARIGGAGDLSQVTTGGDADLSVAGGPYNGAVDALNGSIDLMVAYQTASSADLSAKTGVYVWSLGGIQGGSLTTTEGPVSVRTFDFVSGSTIHATGGDALVYAHGDVDGSIETDHDAVVTTMAGSTATIDADVDVILMAKGNLNGTINAGQSAFVDVLGDVVGDVTAGLDVFASAGGQVSSTITAGNDAGVSAMGTIAGGSITAGQDASASSYSGIEAPITAGRDAGLWSAESISSLVTAGESAGLFAAGTISGDITSGTDVSAQTLTSLTGNITAGEHASVVSYGNLTGDIHAGIDVGVFALNAITSGGLTAGTGDVAASSFGVIDTTISAGNDVAVWAAGIVNLPVTTAGANVSISSQSTATLDSITAGADVGLSAFGNLDAMSINAGGNVDLFGASTVRTVIHSATNASVFSAADQESVVDALMDVGLVALGASLKATVNAGENASAHTSGSISASSISAGTGTANMSASGPIANSSVHAGSDASVFSGSDVTWVEITSDNATASLMTSGSAAHAVLNGATDVGAVAGGTISTSTFNAPNSVGLTAGEVIDSTVIAGDAASIASLGPVTLSLLQTGSDADILALGDVDVFGRIGGSLWAASDGTLTGDYVVDDDIVALYGRTGVTGTYYALDHIDAVISNAGIDANINAGVDPDDPAATPSDDDSDGVGIVNLVRAWDNVAGAITASTSINQVVAGGQVTATLDAPSVGEVRENDRDGFNFYEMPYDDLTFDWLGALAADIAHGDNLSREAIADSVAITNEATSAAHNDLQKGLSEAQEDIALIKDVAAQRAAWRAARLEEDKSDATESAIYMAKGIAGAVSQNIVSLTAEEANHQQLLDYKMVELEHRHEAYFQQTLQTKERAAEATGATAVISGIVNQQLAEAHKELRRRGADAAGNVGARRLGKGMHHVDSCEALYEDVSDCAFSNQLIAMIGQETLSNATDVQVGAVFGLLLVVGVGGGHAAVPLATAMGGGLGGAVGSAAVIGGAEYAVTWGGIYAISGGQTHLLPSIDGILEASATGAAFGGVFHVGSVGFNALKNFVRGSSDDAVFAMANSSKTWGKRKLSYSGIRQQQAQSLLEEAAIVVGVKLDDYVDDVVFTTHASFFAEIGGVKTIGINAAGLRRQRAGQLILGVHELNHAIESAQFTYAAYMKYYKTSLAHRAIVEMRVQHNAIVAVDAYLGGLSAQQRIWAERYIINWSQHLY